MPYTQEELQNYQWYQDRIKNRKVEYQNYLKQIEETQTENQVRNHITDENGVLLSFEDIDDDKRAEEPFKRAGLDRPDHNIIAKNQYPVFNKGQKFDITIDTRFSQLTQNATSLPSVRVFDAPNENLLTPRLNDTADADGTLLQVPLLTPSRQFPITRTDGFTFDLVNGDIIASPDWNNTIINTEEEGIDNYLQVYYLENNLRRQFPTQQILSSYVGTLLSFYIEYEIVVIEKEDLELIPLGTPMAYNVG